MEDFIQSIVTDAGRIIMNHFGKVGVEYTKRDASDVVTKADLEANEFLVKSIQREYPEHGIISEEAEEHNAGAEYVWTIDPLDGTLNFATGVPLFGTMVSVMKNRKVVYACILNPSTNEIVYAQKGEGVTLNGKRVMCSQRDSIEHSYGIVTARMSENQSIVHRAIIEEAKNIIFTINQIGSVAIDTTYLVDGRRDWKAGRGAKIWDYAPMYLALIEAGCVATTLDGRPWTPAEDSMLVANPTLHAKLLEMIKKI